MSRWVPGTPRPDEATLRALFPGIRLGGDYLVYTRPNMTHMPVSQMRAIGAAWNIPQSTTLTRAQLRAVILGHPNNRSPVPHPLIVVPA